MARDAKQHRHDLRAIAHQAMLDKNLQPDFPKAALAQAGALSGPAERPDPSIKDLRDCRECRSTTTTPRIPTNSPPRKTTDGTRLLVAIADVDALVRKSDPIDDHARINTTSIYTAPDLPDAAAPALDRPLLARAGRRAPRDRHPVTVRADASIAFLRRLSRARPQSRQARLQQPRGVARNERPPRAVATQAELRDQIHQDERRNGSHRAARARRARLQPSGAPSSPTAPLRPRRRGRTARRADQDLMIAANGVTARFLAGAGLPAAARPARAWRWDRIVQLAADLGESSGGGRCGALEGSSREEAQGRSAAFPILALDRQAHGAGRIQGHLRAEHRRDTSASCAGLRSTRRTGASGPHHPAADQGRHREEQDAPRRRAERARAPLHRPGGQRQQVERLVRKAAAALLLEHRIGEQFDGIVTGASDKGPMSGSSARPSRARRPGRGMDVGRRSASLIDTNVERGYIDFGPA